MLVALTLDSADMLYITLFFPLYTKTVMLLPAYCTEGSESVRFVQPMQTYTDIESQY